MSTSDKKTPRKILGISSEIAMEGDTVSSMDTLKKVLGFIGNYRFWLILSILLSCVSGVLQLYIPILFGQAVDYIIKAGQVDFAGMEGELLHIFVLTLLTGAAVFAMNLINNKMTYKVVQDIRAKAIRRIEALPLSYLDAHSAGDIVSRVIADVDQLSDGLLLGFSQLFSGVVTIVVTLIFMLRKSVPITLLVVLLTPLSFFVAKFIAKNSYEMFRRQSETRGEQTALINEMIGGEKVVKAFGYEQTASDRFREINGRLEEYSRKATFFSSLTNPSTRFVNSVIYAAVALVGSLIILAGNLTVGGLTVLLSYASQYTKPFNDISSVVTELQNALACAARVFALIEEPTESKDPEKELKRGDAALRTESAVTRTAGGERRSAADAAVLGNVDIENVSFSYVKDKELIRDFNLAVKPGQKIAIVGPTGCGKTTFINLLMRFYDVDDGAIRVDGQDIREVSRHSLRRNYGMVLQDTWLKNDTVRANINIGKPDASEEEIIAAAKEAHSWEFIRRLPQGLDTVIGEDSLSQGQKQLLCITRVMLSLPPMLILDEATSSIDTRTELQIQEAFDKLMRGRTSFVVAHRLSTIRTADVILVMKDGRIIEQGNHESLMQQDGFYAKLYTSQFARAE